MKYTVQSKDITSATKKLQEFTKKYPKSKTFRFELSELWQPVDFLIEVFKETEDFNQRLIELPIDCDLIPSYEIDENRIQKLESLGIRFEVPKQSDRILSKVLPENVDMSRLTPKEWDDLIEEILIKQVAINKREESQKVMEREIEESLQDVDDLRQRAEEETELYRS